MSVCQYICHHESVPNNCWLSANFGYSRIKMIPRYKTLFLGFDHVTNHKAFVENNLRGGEMLFEIEKPRR